MRDLFHIKKQIVFVLILSLSSLPCFAEGQNGSCDDEMKARIEKRMDSRPEAPPQLRETKKINFVGCQRNFEYNEEILSIDSFHKQDAEGLRSIVEDVPAAVSALDDYQANRRNVRIAAYTGAAGLAFMLSAFLLANTLSDTETGQSDIRKVGLIGGISVIGGGTIYGLALLSANEGKIAQVVNHYNQAHPERKIQLRFSTGLDRIFGQ